MADVYLSTIVIGGPSSKSQEPARPGLIADATSLDTSVAWRAFRRFLFPFQDVIGDMESIPARFVVGYALTGPSKRQRSHSMVA